MKRVDDNFQPRRKFFCVPLDIQPQIAEYVLIYANEVFKSQTRFDTMDFNFSRLHRDQLQQHQVQSFRAAAIDLNYDQNYIRGVCADDSNMSCY